MQQSDYFSKNSLILSESIIIEDQNEYNSRSIKEIDWRCNNNSQQLEQPNGDSGLDFDYGSDSQYFENVGQIEQVQSIYYDSVAHDDDDDWFYQTLKKSFLASRAMRREMRSAQQEETELIEVECEFEGLKQSIYRCANVQFCKPEVSDRNMDVIIKDFINSGVKDTQGINFNDQNQVHRGQIIKFNGNVIINSKLKDCVLQNGILKLQGVKKKQNQYDSYYDFDLFDYKCFCSKNNSNQTIISLFSDQQAKYKKFIKFKLNSEEETEKWYKLISEQIQRYNQSVKMLISDKFWKQIYLREEKFRQIVQCGDILLFRGNSFMCKLQRFFTGSQYDHVALIYRTFNGKIYGFEASSNGVGLFIWDDMIRKEWYKLYDKLAIRSLVCNRDSKFNKQIENFLRQNIGKEYRLSVSKLLKKESLYGHPESNFKNRTYFCSELVAAAYKSLDLLPQKVSTTQYWPGSFSQEQNNIQLLNDAYLADEQIIIFQND